jgi:hypothetical protein
MRDPEAAMEPGSEVIAKLIYGWGNEKWSALDEYLEACIRDAISCGGPILECGSGLTTIIIGVIARKYGNEMWSLEHTEEWGDRVKKYLKRYRIDSVRMCVRSLKKYTGFSWYDPPLDSMPENFALMICDGPPGDTQGGRYGLAVIMKDRMRPDCVILLDDAEREEERSIAERWSRQLDAGYEIHGSCKPYIRLTLKRGG